MKPIAFYLPQFHRVTENDLWWGQGFTEWTNVAKGKPNFDGHYQPHIPKDLGFYDLANVEVMREQATLAEQYGLHGFCFYYYRFKNGRRILEKPLSNYIESDINFPFCYCWANENWTKTWDGLDKEILLEQNHDSHDDIDFINEIMPSLKDERYIKVDGKPMLLVYRVDLFKDIKKTVKRWREIAIEQGLPGLHLCAVQFYGIDDPNDYGFDAAVEFPPHKYIGPENRPNEPLNITNPKFTGGVVDYRKMLAQSLNRVDPGYKLYRGIIPSWDNTARRQDSGHTIINSSPRLYNLWLSYLRDYTRKRFKDDEQYVFINAWNEWAEGAHLEPDLKYGQAYLEETLKAVNGKKVDINSLITNSDILSFILNNINQEDIDIINTALTDCRSQLVYRECNANMHVSNIRFRDILKYRFKWLYQKLLPTYALTRKFVYKIRAKFWS